MRFCQIFLFASALCLSVAAQALGQQQGDSVAKNPQGWTLPWLEMKYSVSKRVVLLYNDKPTELHQQPLTFAPDTAIPVPACDGTHFLKTDSVTRVDFQGHVFDI